MPRLLPVAVLLALGACAASETRSALYHYEWACWTGDQDACDQLPAVRAQARDEAEAADQQFRNELVGGAAGYLAVQRMQGAPPPVVSVAPTQTTCYRAGPQVICNTQ